MTMTKEEKQQLKELLEENMLDYPSDKFNIYEVDKDVIAFALEKAFLMGKESNKQVLWFTSHIKNT